MKTFIKILCLVVSNFAYAQQPVVFHFNFSFEREYNSITSNELLKISIYIFEEGSLAWEKNLIDTDFIKDKYGNVLMSDTIPSLAKNKKYNLIIEYELKHKTDTNKCSFIFDYPDSVEHIALELFFDQAKVLKMSETILFRRTKDEYALELNPKPCLIIKYWNNTNDIFLAPTWFNSYSITLRPKYILNNQSQHTIYRKDDGLLTHFFGDLYIWDFGGIWIDYLYGGMCGTYNPTLQIEAGMQEYIIEGFPVGTPRKLIGGYYRYTVSYRDHENNVKNTETYFRVVYVK